ncbi:MAG: peptidoglycan editing factor PgeF [Alphaproteobacteria bacterium]|jgi:YfiH family protein|nr:peptidoglycan editing factor PgeF [Alphaproteobacteria bacterium]MCV6599606.1 peptidoglycan editing factor PgeF [Alphaproteobacteria bacterium]
MIKYNFGDKSFVLDYRKLSDNYVFPKQVHGSKILIINSLEEAKNIDAYSVEVDATITKERGVILCISTADCAPIILVDRDNNIISAVHAGWKSACKGIITKTIKEMVRLGADSSSIKAYIGPCLGKESFECEKDMMNSFLEADKKNSVFFERKNEIKYLFDLKSFCVNELKKSEVTDISVSDIDTYTDNNYHSYREFEANNPNIKYEFGKYRNLTTVEIK